MRHPRGIPEHQRTQVPRTRELSELQSWVEREPVDGVGRFGLLVGHSGMGKTVLLSQFAELCERHPGKPWFVRSIQISRSEQAPPWERILADAQSAIMDAPTVRSSQDRETLGKLLRGIPGFGHVLQHLIAVDRRPSWERLVEYLANVSAKLAENGGRLVILLDPQGSMAGMDTGDWESIAQNLPPCLRIVIAQWPDDPLAATPAVSRRFAVLPDAGPLGEFTREQVERLYENERRFGFLSQATSEWSESLAKRVVDVAFERYRGYPLAHGSIIRLIIAQPPDDPVAAIQSWPEEVTKLMDMLFDCLAAQGEDRLRAMLTLHVFGVPAPAETWAQAAGMSTETMMVALSDTRFAQLLNESSGEQGPCYDPFHPLFSERLERELSRFPKRADELAQSAWRAIEPALDADRLKETRPPDFELRASAGVIRRVAGYKLLTEVMNRVFDVKLRVGWLDDATADIESLLSNPDCTEVDRAVSFANLGLVQRIRGDFARAEAMLHQALTINERLGRIDGAASVLGNLGVIYQTRGELGKAEDMHRRALAIDEKLNHPERIAVHRGNLGIIYGKRGDVVQAEEMIRTSLETYERLGHLEGTANQCCNLGLIYQARGDLAEAEAMHRRALEINERLGRLEGMAIDCCNLGLICQARGDLAEAEAMHRRALEINERLGRLEGMAIDYGNLGVTYHTRGNLDASEAMLRKSLEINEKLGCLGGVADQYRNLGVVCRSRGDLTRAVALWVKARDLFDRMGSAHNVAKLQTWIDALGAGGAAPPDSAE